MREWYPTFTELYPLLRHVMSGAAFFSGTLLAVIGCGLLLLRGHWITRGLGWLLVPLGAALRVASSTPEPLWLDWAWSTALTVAVAGAVARSRWGWFKRAALVAAGVFAVVSAVSAGVELPWRLTPDHPCGKCGTVYVIGDSFSTGIGRENMPWPRLLARRLQAPVVNLAHGGSTVASAIEQVGRLPAQPGDGCVVVLEIGGNNMLQRREIDTFETDLERLIFAVQAPGRRVIMLELPLQPLSSSVGQAQRHLARKYGVELIPKRHFAAAVMSAGHTLPDNPHLSDAGHEAMARMVGDYLDGKL